MVLKHIYLYTSDTSIIREIREDNLFFGCPQYEVWEMPFTHQNEYGKIKTKKNHYHLLIGQMPQENCPWCGCPVAEKKISHQYGLSHDRYFLECMGCQSRGPTLNVNPAITSDDPFMDELRDLMHQRYIHRRPWNDGFVNKYEL